VDTPITSVTVWPSQNNVGGGKKLNEPMVSAAFRAFTADSFIVSGFSVPTESGPQLTIAAGEAVINGYRVYMSDPSIVECSEDVDNYVFIKLLKDGLGQVTEVAFEVNTTGIQPVDSVPICKTTIAAGSIYTSPILAGSQLTIGGRYAVIAGTLRHTVDGWQINDEADCRPVNILDAGYDDTEGCLYIDYSHLDVARVVSMVATPDQQLAAGGVTVGVNLLDQGAQLVLGGSTVGGWVEFTQASGNPVIHDNFGLTGITLDDPPDPGLPRFFLHHLAVSGEDLVSMYPAQNFQAPHVETRTPTQMEIWVEPGINYYFHICRRSIGPLSPQLLGTDREIHIMGLVELNR
jgi:hypothetical protein